MADPKPICVIGKDVVLIEHRGDHWVLDGKETIPDISKCKVEPSEHERRIVLSVQVQKDTLPKPKPQPDPVPLPPAPPAVLVAVDTPAPTVEEVLEIVEDTILEKVMDKYGDNLVTGVMLLGFALFQKVSNTKQTKAQEEMDKKCQGRHGDSSGANRELLDQVEQLKGKLEEMSSSFEIERKGHVSKGEMKKLLERVEELEKLTQPATPPEPPKSNLDLIDLTQKPKSSL